VTTPADELRTAAATLRKLTGQATPAPWATTWRGQEYQLDGNTDEDLSPIAEWTYAVVTTEPKASEQRAECDTANADYIAVMHPGVGAALAGWLTDEARRVECASSPAGQEIVGRRALAVARAVNA
jgi:hypothetical protein